MVNLNRWYYHLNLSFSVEIVLKVRLLYERLGFKIVAELWQAN